MIQVTGYLIVDRIENGIAALELEGRSMQMVPLSLLPEGVAEGDVLLEREGRYTVDRAETIRRREENRRLFERLRGGREGE